MGRAGVPISSLADMEIMLDGIPLDKVSTSMTINATASVLLALYIAVGQKQGVSADKLTGTIQNDILKEYIARGTYIYPPRPSMRLVTDVFKYCSQNVPRWNTISVSGYHMSEAGATAVQDLAFTLSNAIAYVKAALDSGLDVDEFAGRLSFFFVAQSNLFEEVAKYRAARRMWASLMRNRFGAENPRSWMMRFHTQTAGVTLTAQQPDNNVIRTTMQALAAVLGGTQSLHANARDEALALPTEESAQLSLRNSAGNSPRERGHGNRRPAGGFLLRGEPDRQAGGGGSSLHRPHRGDGRSSDGTGRWLPGPRDPRERIQAPARHRIRRAACRWSELLSGPTPPIEKLQTYQP